MGTDYSVGLGIGYVFTAEQVLAPFLRVVPEQSHMEDRFDSKTGAKLPPVKIIDVPRRESYVLDDSTLYAWDVIETLAKKFGVKLGWIGGDNDGRESVMFCVNDPYNGKAQDPSNHLTVHHTVIPATRTFNAELAELREKLLQIGLKPGEPVFRIFCWWG